MLLVHRHQNIILNFNDAVDGAIEEELRPTYRDLARTGKIRIGAP